MSDWISEEEFTRRFVAHMLSKAGTKTFAGGNSVKEHARKTAKEYYDLRELSDVNTPEQCADIAISYWEQ